MLFIILGIIAGLVVLIHDIIKQDFYLGFLGGIGTFLVFVVVWLITILGINTNVNDNNLSYETIESVEIYCLEDNKGIEGTHYLFSGSIDEKLYYYYVYDNSLGKTTNKIPAADSYINYTDKDFRVETLGPKHKNRFAGFWLGADYTLLTKYKVYIPEGSISVEDNYNIDLK